MRQEQQVILHPKQEWYDGLLDVIEVWPIWAQIFIGITCIICIGFLGYFKWRK